MRYIDQVAQFLGKRQAMRHKYQLRRRIEKECLKEIEFINAWNQPKGLLTTAPGSPPNIDETPFDELSHLGDPTDIDFLRSLLKKCPEECTIEDMDLDGNVYGSEPYNSRTRALIKSLISKIQAEL